jgi:heptosyltransferase-1
VSETSDIASPKKILIVRLGAMGDIVHALPAATVLRAAFPRTKIGWLVEKRWRELLNLSPLVDHIHEVDTRRWRKNLLSTRHESLSAIRNLQHEHYDVTVDFQGALKSAVFAQLSGAESRFGFAAPWEKPASLFYTHAVPVRRRHVVEQNIELANEVVLRKGGDSQNDILCVVFSPSSELQLQTAQTIAHLQLGTRFAILNPGAGWGAKQWPLERYSEVARALGAQGVRSLINFGPGEEELARQVEMNSDGHAVAASFTISQLMALTRKAALFIGGDTGPLHLASLLQVPVVAIFGPTDPARTGPYGTRSIILRDPSSITSHKRRREAEAGLWNISTGQVLNASLELLNVSPEGVRP